MRAYTISLVVGIVVGVLYGLLKVRSPAPPAVALIGLLGMLVGEQSISLLQSALDRGHATERHATPPVVDGDGKDQR